MKIAVKEAESLSRAEITQACDDAVKETILADWETVTATLLKKMLHERRLAYGQEGQYSEIHRCTDLEMHH